MATTAADLVSATKRIASGPKARGPMDLNSGLPSFMPAVQEAADRGVTVAPQTTRAQTKVMRFMVFIAWIFLGYDWCEPLYGIETSASVTGKTARSLFPNLGWPYRLRPMTTFRASFLPWASVAGFLCFCL